jgi:hypothetical protein
VQLYVLRKKLINVACRCLPFSFTKKAAEYQKKINITKSSFKIMNTSLLTFCYLSCFLSILCLLIILFQNKFHVYYKFIVLLCLISCILVIGLWTFFQGKIPLLEHAHLWVLSFPFDYLPGSLLYLYTKSVLERQKKITKWDSLHFVPALLHFFEFIPFYLLPVESKQLFLTSYLLHFKNLSEQTFFILPIDVHIFFKTALWLFYVLLTFRLLILFYKKKPLWIIRNNHIWFWITRLAGIHAISVLLPIFGLTFFDKYTYREFSILPLVIFILTSVILLMFKPKILYGLSHIYNDNNTIKLKKEEDIFSKTFKIPPSHKKLFSTRYVK